MTENEWWLRIEAFALARDWNGLAVAADGLTECGTGRMADCLRWISRRRLRINYVDTKAGRKWFTHINSEQLTCIDRLAGLIDLIQTEREDQIAYYT